MNKDWNSSTSDYGVDQAPIDPPADVDIREPMSREDAENLVKDLVDKAMDYRQTSTLINQDTLTDAADKMVAILTIPRPDPAEVEMTITELVKDIHETAKSKGWWEDILPIPTLLCLVHSEVSEALEAYRREDMSNFEEELADIVIRIFDMAGGLGIDIEKAIINKVEANKLRTYKHGGKLI